tara:strand:+ start:2626 stop:3207 length:582 start_codon:yes stop_codon:yes gene_type:complete
MIVTIGNFEAGDLTGWKEKQFKGKTTYALGQVDGKRALMAKSSASASGLYKLVDIALDKTPYLNWSWRVNNTLRGLDELTKAGDDYPARVYVIFQNGGMFRRSRFLTYVWSSDQPINSSWQSAYTRHSIVIAVQSKNTNVGQWVIQKRNIRDDYRRYFSEDARFANGIALMTDTDNSKQSAIAYYGNIFLSGR